MNLSALLYEESGRRLVPSWLGEGLSQFFECLSNSCSLVYPVKKSELDFDTLVGENFANHSASRARKQYLKALFIIVKILIRQMAKKN